jgi:beta-glucanase (GH16 family)
MFAAAALVGGVLGPGSGVGPGLGVGVGVGFGVGVGEAPIPGYELVWHDEFEGEELDATKWKPWALGPRRDAVNVADAATLDGEGCLVISTRRAERGGETVYESGGVWTEGLYEPTFGYLEARIRLQTQIGHWSAFWLNCSPMGEPVGDPHAGGVETDIMEFHRRMRDGTAVQHNLHWDGYGDAHKSRGREVSVQGLAEGFHTFGVLWTAEEYVFFVDGVETLRVREAEGGAISRRAEYLILSLEVGDWAGDIAGADLPDGMVVDWVRVWEKRE